MATFSKAFLSGSTEGKQIRISAAASPGTIVHTANSNASITEELWIYATLNNTPSALTVTNIALTSNVATLTTSTSHGLFINDTVKVTGISTTLNGMYTVASVPTVNTFTYSRIASNVTSAASGGTVTVKELAAGTSAKLTIQWGGTTAPDDAVTYTLPNENGLYLIVPGLVLKGNATPYVVRAFSDTANVVSVSGFVNRIS